jgi:hypothetical protein
MTSLSFHESFLLYPKGKFQIFLKIKENDGSHEYTDPLARLETSSQILSP